ncbi:uncharacterized protein LOC127291587 isoform X2 [Leptopilina boulardi]|uniref:uncharacterized protein LOC127291587 isoform X2 n=1 Tax=Leptopilina boulardi TaxID=63433 RepID=UPI0021F5507E|nr:uncharacterized protein LOC127291587 isoform X2 [Leptopilina boulardi]
MSQYHLSQKRFIPVPPEKGSFPLDHEGICKSLMIKYMRCLVDNKNDSGMCRNVTQDYLECRMDNGLMAREEWSKLGFSNQIPYKTRVSIHQAYHETRANFTFSHFHKLPADVNQVDLKQFCFSTKGDISKKKILTKNNKKKKITKDLFLSTDRIPSTFTFVSLPLPTKRTQLLLFFFQTKVFPNIEKKVWQARRERKF